MLATKLDIFTFNIYSDSHTFIGIKFSKRNEDPDTTPHTLSFILPYSRLSPLLPFLLNL